jgi:hypothetical protein
MKIGFEKLVLFKTTYDRCVSVQKKSKQVKNQHLSDAFTFILFTKSLNKTYIKGIISLSKLRGKKCSPRFVD